MNKEAIWAFFLACGWEPDRWGHLQQTVTRADGDKRFRMKFQARSVRFEVKSGSNWFLLASDYYSKMSLRPDGALHLSNKVFKSPEQLAEMRASK